MIFVKEFGIPEELKQEIQENFKDKKIIYTLKNDIDDKSISRIAEMENNLKYLIRLNIYDNEVDVKYIECFLKEKFSNDALTTSS
jgi:hypothetical protein